MPTRFAVASALMGPEDESLSVASAGHAVYTGVFYPPQSCSPAAAHVDHESETDLLKISGAASDDLKGQPGICSEEAGGSTEAENAETSSAWEFFSSAGQMSDPAVLAPTEVPEGFAGKAFTPPGGSVSGFSGQPPQWPWKKTPMALTVAAAIQGLFKMHTVIWQLISGRASRSHDIEKSRNTSADDSGVESTPNVAMAFNQRGRASELLQYPFLSK